MDRVSACVTTFITSVLGPRYVEPPVLDIKVSVVIGGTMLDEKSVHIKLHVYEEGLVGTAILLTYRDDSSKKKHLIAIYGAPVPSAGYYGGQFCSNYSD